MEEGTLHSREEIIAGLQKHAIPFTTVQPGSSFEDLMLLKQLIGDARIVALGEATHGTREFFLMKHRLLEFLVKEMHFNLFAIEATWAESNLINEYVHTGKGDPAQLLAGLYFWTWNTQEVLDMILWMHNHNQAPGDAPRVGFRGFDMQSFHMAMDNVLTYLHNVAPETEEEAKALYATFRQYVDHIRDYGELPLHTKSQCRANLQRVYDLLLDRRAAYEAMSSSEAFAHALQSARIVLQSESVFVSDDYEWRDLYMAENVAWLLEQAGPEAKIVLWAHNGHISKNALSGDSMGAHLRKRYGDAMITFGFSFYQGSFHAIDRQPGSETQGMLVSHEVPSPPEKSYEYMLGAVGLQHMFLDLRSIAAGSAIADWLAGPHLSRSLGAVYSAAQADLFFYYARLPEEYDVIIHLQDTTPSTLLSSVDRQKKRAIKQMRRQPRNLNFEAEWTGWQMTGNRSKDYERRIEQLNGENISAYFGSKVDEAPGFGAFAQMIAADEYRGKQLRLAADVKSEEIEQWAGLWMRVDGLDGQSQSFDNMQDRAIQGSSDWTRYEIVLPVYEDSQAIVFGILLSGKGKLWLRNVQIEVVGEI